MESILSLDPATAALILRFQLQDAQELLTATFRKGKGREGSLTDAQLSLQLFEQDLQRSSTILSDRQMTSSIATACQAHGGVLQLSEIEEHLALTDREAAYRHGGVETAVAVKPLPNGEAVVNKKLLEKTEALYVAKSMGLLTSHGDDESDAAESSSWALTLINKDVTMSSRHLCIACLESFRFFEVARVPCHHEYCGPCLMALFNASLIDVSLFPPRCCKKPILPEDKVCIFINSALAQKYEQKKIEHETKNRTYCSNPKCLVFLQAANHRNVERATCPECERVTCTICKAEGHDGDCPKDEGILQVLEMASEKGWRRCGQCKAVVELDTGCYHITCRCGSQFCYLCGASWKTCTCPHWDESRLYSRTSQVVERRGGRENRQARVDAVAGQSRTDHGCAHREGRRSVAGRA
ncbi:hypothetical protein BJ875DRAFT_448003 [Amylocarpus encephaloides]|uniref:RBR-type E3 ubiquitin transferase n=1 Tax=Amylocarpus encephaloides TaxID=45428 RepID=A0A9P8CA90_9HELO|nr:hypothetical protein BJ875DRAFT_448003 [Amylocarpus encephaloides]